MMTQRKIEKDLVIRNLRREDKVSIVEVDSLSTGYRREIYFDRKFKRLFGEDAPFLMGMVAEFKGKVIGFIMGEVNVGEFGMERPVASIDTIGIHPQFRRKGIGKMLLDEYCSMAAKAGIEVMTTLVSEDWPEVVAFFTAQGFKPVRMMAMEKKLPREGLFCRE
ncbi:MAG: GNAT family N-acetyltransferase [bacterium]